MPVHDDVGGGDDNELQCKNFGTQSQTPVQKKTQTPVHKQA